MVRSNIDIAQAAQMLPIEQIAERLGIPRTSLEPYGRYKAKVALRWLAGLDGPTGRQARPGDRGVAHAGG